MSKASREFIEQVKQPEASVGFLEAMKESIQAIAPGLSVEKFVGDVLEKGEQMWTQGRSEIAQALFTEGTACVPCGPGQNPTDKDHGHPLHGAKQPEVQQEQGRSGMEM